MEIKIAKRTRTPRMAFDGIGPDTAVHGLTDGTWSMIDAIRELLRHTGPADLVVSTWTAAGSNIIDAERMLRSQAIRSLRLVVDRSFLTRQPKYCETARRLFGDDAIRVWSSHAKFCLILGNDVKILYLTSANLNKNPRIESFSIFQSDTLCADYLTLVDDLYRMQAPGEGFSEPRSGRWHTEALMDARR